MSKIPFFIGSCVIESTSHASEVADYLVTELKEFEGEIDLHFKGSFDKANRSSIDSYRGPGLNEGLKILGSISKKYGLKTITDFHSPDQAKEVASVVDVLQVPAFLCRQTDMIVAGAKACAEYKRILKVKKGQFMAPDDTSNIVEKAKSYIGLDQIYLTERGTSFGYQTLIVDMASFTTMKALGVKCIHDATHCVQRPGGLGKSSGGKREFIIPLAKAAIAAGADGIFMEAHPNPSEAKSDAATQLELSQVKDLVRQFVSLKRFMEKL